MSVAIDYTSGAFAANKAQSVGTITGSTLDVSSGQYFEFTPTANTTFAFSNAPASGTAAGFALAVTGAEEASGYDLANASYDSVSADFSAQESNLYSAVFNGDGTKLFTLGYASDSVHEYSLSTAYDLSTASYTSNSFSVASQAAVPFGLAFSNDGTKFYIAASDNVIYQYSMSSAWDITTASYSSISKSVSAAGSGLRAIDFKPDGTKLYVLGNTSKAVYQYSMSTAWDVSTASYDSISFSVSGQTSNASDISFSPDGSVFILCDAGGAYIRKYTISTPWLISSSSWAGSFSVSSENTSPSGVVFNASGTKMYVLKNSTGVNIWQYTTGTSAPATFTYPSSVDWPSGTAPDAPAVGETDVLVFYTEDGGTTYYGFQAGDAMA
jgi:sugar lactone lactonase YvrE